MLRIMPKSAVLSFMIVVITQLKWALDFILYQSFFQPRQIGLQAYVNNLRITEYSKKMESNEEAAECAVCLCRIDEGDEVRELRCDHLFHKVCLDRWLGYGHATCPLCRSNLTPPPLAADELIVLSLSAARSSDDRETWWLR